MPPVKQFRKKSILFLAKFFLIYALLQSLILFLPLDFLQQFIAWAEASLLGLHSTGNVILIRGHAFEIAENCTGLMGTSILAAVIFSLSKPSLGKKLGLLLLGSFVLFPANLLRLYIVLLVALAFNPEAAALLHIVTWFAMSALILVLWYGLSKRLAGVKALHEML